MKGNLKGKYKITTNYTRAQQRNWDLLVIPTITNIKKFVFKNAKPLH